MSRGSPRGHTPANHPRVPFRQVLSAESLHQAASGCTFFAVIIDPDTQKAIARYPIGFLSPGEVVELALERRTDFPPREEVP